MRLGVVLPSFSQDASDALSVANVIEDAGIHGAFCYDHLWPMGEPGKPAISPYPLLGALTQLTSTISLGTLVSRVGVVPDDVLVNELATLHELAGDRFIASLGTGDRKSEAENIAYGAPYPDADTRRAELLRIATRLIDLRLNVWIGGGAAATNALAHDHGATLNLWGVPIDKIRHAAQTGKVSWSGRFPKTHELAVQHLKDLRDAGATWAVYIWPDKLELLVDAANAANVALDGNK